MEMEQTGVKGFKGMRGLTKTGLVMVCHDPKTGEFVLVAAKNIRRKWLVFNVPEAVWRGRGSKLEVIEESKRLLEETLLAD